MRFLAKFNLIHLSDFISAQFIRYAIVGALNTLLFFGLVNLLGALFGVYSGLAFTAISALSVSLVIIHSYLWNRRWVFRSRERERTGEFVKFALVNFGALAINAGIVYAVTTLVPPHPWFSLFGGLAKIFWANFAEGLSIIAVVVWNYFWFKFFVFRSSVGQERDARVGAMEANQEAAPLKKSATHFAIVLASFSLLVGFLSIGPLVAISRYLASEGQPFVLSYENYRNDLTYLTIAREVADGHSPWHDPFADQSSPTPRNPLPPLVMGFIIRASGGNIFRAYLAALFIFSQIIFLLLYLLARRFSFPRVFAIFFATVGTITPILFRILNFHGTP